MLLKDKKKSYICIKKDCICIMFDASKLTKSHDNYMSEETDAKRLRCPPRLWLAIELSLLNGLSIDIR